jgi:hypothetical protein
MIPLDDIAPLIKVVLALRPHLDRMILVGGWCHRLYTLRPEALVDRFRPLTTDDADIVLDMKSGVSGPQISDLLAPDFEARYFGETRPPVAEYRLKGSRSGFTVEFLVPQRGDGTRNQLVSISGVVAQSLRYVEILAYSPWAIRLDEASGVPVRAAPIDVMVANPACYLAQKVLTIPERQTAKKRAKDILYVHDTVLLFADRLDELRELWTTVSHRIHAAWLGRVEKNIGRLFSVVTDASREAALIAASSGRPEPPGPELLILRCREGLERIFLP